MPNRDVDRGARLPTSVWTGQKRHYHMGGGCGT
jgi:hypothetical protein